MIRFLPVFALSFFLLGCGDAKIEVPKVTDDSMLFSFLPVNDRGYSEQFSQLSRGFPLCRSRCVNNHPPCRPQPRIHAYDNVGRPVRRGVPARLCLRPNGRYGHRDTGRRQKHESLIAGENVQTSLPILAPIPAGILNHLNHLARRCRGR